ncbi:hypothetical protein DdX_17435 [Ditylenchus destructor]|uniref:Uncharacterized protein n=1 Tax=Ditylenchus destructor TaxID=166010 RepID=A0AAD4QVT2_9BILA|nr:hypothetical protein DdX_17435 [Ditylenchus destructor]
MTPSNEKEQNLKIESYNGQAEFDESIPTMVIEIMINDRPVNVLWDLGADFTIAPLRILDLTKSKLIPKSTKFYGIANEPINILGNTRVSVKFSNKTDSLLLFLTADELFPENSHFLLTLGKDWMQTFPKFIIDSQENEIRTETQVYKMLKAPKNEILHSPICPIQGSQRATRGKQRSKLTHIFAINGINVIGCIDTGSPISIVNTNFLKNFREPDMVCCDESFQDIALKVIKIKNYLNVKLRVSKECHDLNLRVSDQVPANQVPAKAMYNMIIGRDWIAKLPPISIDYSEGEYRIGKKRLEWMLSPRMRPTILMLKQADEGKKRPGNPTQMCHNFDTPESNSIMNEYRTWKSDCYFDFMNRSLELEELFNELSTAFEQDSAHSIHNIEICARSSSYERKLVDFLLKLQKLPVGDRNINIKLTFHEELDIRCDIFNSTDGSYSTSETIRIAQQARCALIQYKDTISKLKNCKPILRRNINLIVEQKLDFVYWVYFNENPLEFLKEQAKHLSEYWQPALITEGNTGREYEVMAMTGTNVAHPSVASILSSRIRCFPSDFMFPSCQTTPSTSSAINAPANPSELVKITQNSRPNTNVSHKFLDTLQVIVLKFDFSFCSLELEKIIREVDLSKEGSKPMEIVIKARAQDCERTFVSLIMRLQKVAFDNRKVNVQIIFQEDYGIKCAKYVAERHSYLTKESLDIIRHACASRQIFDNALQRLRDLHSYLKTNIHFELRHKYNYNLSLTFPEIHSKFLSQYARYVCESWVCHEPALMNKEFGHVILAERVIKAQGPKLIGIIESEITDILSRDLSRSHKIIGQVTSSTSGPKRAGLENAPFIVNKKIYEFQQSVMFKNLENLLNATANLEENYIRHSKSVSQRIFGIEKKLAEITSDSRTSLEIISQKIANNFQNFEHKIVNFSTLLSILSLLAKKVAKVELSELKEGISKQDKQALAIELTEILTKLGDFCELEQPNEITGNQSVFNNDVVKAEGNDKSELAKNSESKLENPPSVMMLHTGWALPNIEPFTADGSITFSAFTRNFRDYLDSIGEKLADSEKIGKLKVLLHGFPREQFEFLQDDDKKEFETAITN